MDANENEKKKCERCGEDFYRGVTTKNIYCDECEKKLSDYTCDNCGERIFEGDKCWVKRECTIEKIGIFWGTVNSDNVIEELLCENCK